MMAALVTHGTQLAPLSSPISGPEGDYKDAAEHSALPVARSLPPGFSGAWWICSDVCLLGNKAGGSLPWNHTPPARFRVVRGF